MTTTAWLEVTTNGCYAEHRDYYLDELVNGHDNDVSDLQEMPIKNDF